MHGVSGAIWPIALLRLCLEDVDSSVERAVADAYGFFDFNRVVIEYLQRLFEILRLQER